MIDQVEHTPDGHAFVRLADNNLRLRASRYTYWIDLVSTPAESIGRVFSPLLLKRFNLEGQIQFVERGTRGGNCATYLFGEVLNEVWGKHPALFDRSCIIYTNTEAFLKTQGYENVLDEPSSGDVVAYGKGLDSRALYEGIHFGQVLEDGWMRSKVGKKPIFRHRIEVVSPLYGDMAFFFRKPKEAQY